MANAKEYQKLLKLPKKPKNALNNIRIKKMCSLCHKSRHLKEQCHWNPKNLNNKSKDKKEVSMTKISYQAGRSTNGNHKK
jgi:hypothetical protein